MGVAKRHWKAQSMSLRVGLCLVLAVILQLSQDGGRVDACGWKKKPPPPPPAWRRRSQQEDEGKVTSPVKGELVTSAPPRNKEEFLANIKTLLNQGEELRDESEDDDGKNDKKNTSSHNTRRRLRRHG